MSIEKLSRRAFLQLSGRSGAGLMLGASAAAVSPMGWADAAPFPIAPATPAAALAMNLFIHIAPDDKVYIVAHRSEMGQGSRTGLPQVAADELDADWEKVVVLQARGDAAYGSQNTDGSRSVRDFYQKMREMGASARMMLRQAAANHWQISIEQCQVHKHRVLRNDSKASLSFGELAEAASQVPLPQLTQLRYKSAKDFRYIGKDVAIVDLHKMTCGDTVFGMDVRLPNMLFASIERCPFLGGSLKSYNAEAAKAVPGVVDIIEIKATPLPAIFHPLPGVAVVASNSWAALEARKKLAVQWQGNAHQDHASEPYIARLKATLKTQTPQVMRQTGDAAEAIAKADHSIEAIYTIPYLAHAAMEPPAATAIVNAEGIEVWACTQTPQSAQRELSQRFGVKPEQVKVNVTLLGGGFGRKSKPDFVVEAALLSQAMSGRPVRVMWSREDDLQNAYYHAASAVKLRVGLDSEKRAVALEATSNFPSISSLWAPDTEHPSAGELELGLSNLPFNIAHETIGSVATTAHTRIGWMRSVCNIQHAFAVGSFVDEIARQTDRSTLDTWLSMIGEARSIDRTQEDFTPDNYGRSLADFPYESGRLKAVLKHVAKASGMEKKTKKGEGWGIAAHYSFLTHVAVATKVKLSGDTLRVEEVHITADCGLAVNPDRVKSQMEGSVVFALSLALLGEITFKGGVVEQSNFDSYPVLRLNQCPKITVYLMPREDSPRGVGEPGVPPVAPSLANAIVAAGGKRIRDLPIKRIYKVG